MELTQAEWLSIAQHAVLVFVVLVTAWMRRGSGKAD